MDIRGKDSIKQVKIQIRKYLHIFIKLYVKDFLPSSLRSVQTALNWNTIRWNIFMDKRRNENKNFKVKKITISYFIFDVVIILIIDK